MAGSPSADQDRPEQVSSLLCVHPTLHESAYLLRTVQSTRSATLLNPHTAIKQQSRGRSKLRQATSHVRIQSRVHGEDERGPVELHA
eukprot:5031503-Pleurochrysis_carterae.AAC.1